MRLYFYFFTLIISCSVFSQEQNFDIIGKWIIKDMSLGNMLILCPIDEEKFIESIINTQIYFSESGKFYCINYENENGFLSFNNSKWNISNDGIVEIKSLKGKELIKFKFILEKGNYFLTFIGDVKFKIEKFTSYIPKSD